MNLSRRERIETVRWLGAISGLTSVALMGTAQRFIPTPPAALTTPPHLVRAFYAANRTHIGLATYLAALGLTALLCFVVALKKILARAEEERSSLSQLALAGGVGTVIVALVGDLFLATLAFRASSMDTQSAWILFTLWNMALSFVCFPAAILIGATCVVIVRTRVFPRWLGLLGFPLALACLVVPTSAHHTNGLLVYGGDYWLPLITAFLLWVSAISASLILRPDEARVDTVRDGTLPLAPRSLEHRELLTDEDRKYSEALP